MLALCACDPINVSENPDTVEEVSDDNLETDTEIMVIEDYPYRTLNDFFPWATDIVKARFIGATTESNGWRNYEFEVIENLRGLGDKEKIVVEDLPANCYVSGENINISFSTYDVQYKQGNSYLLLLCRSTSVYIEEYTFSFVHNSLIIPLDSQMNSAPASGLIYGTPLSGHYGSNEIANTVSNGTFEQYVLTAVENNPMAYGDDYIKSTDISDIIRGSEYILEVVVEYADESVSPDRDRALCDCRVVSLLKGEYNSEIALIIFPIETYEIGETYIVAVTSRGGSSLLTMSSKNSIFSTNQREDIISILYEP